jgi:hypothetical protein
MGQSQGNESVALTEIQEAFQKAVLTEEFNEYMRSKKPFHISSAVADSDFIQTDAVLTAMAKGSETGHASAYKGGEPCTRGNFYLAYLDQASLTLTDAERFFPPLLDLCTSFRPTFPYVSARIVIDPPQARIPTLTADSDMIALQIWGKQRLKICKSIAGLPVTARRPDPLLTPTMCTGDALYVPQGLEVRFEDSPPLQHGETREPTMYAVLSVRTNEQELGTSLGKLVVELLGKSEFPSDSDQFLRSAVTKQTVPRLSHGETSEVDIEKRAHIEASLKAGVEEISKQITAARLREHVAKRMEVLYKEQAEGAAKVAKQKVPDVDMRVFATSHVRVARGVVCECYPGQSKALFTRGGETLPLPIAESASYMISELSDGKPHLVSSLTCGDPLERVCVCQILIFKKCLEIHLTDAQN